MYIMHFGCLLKFSPTSRLVVSWLVDSGNEVVAGSGATGKVGFNDCKSVAAPSRALQHFALLPDVWFLTDYIHFTSFFSHNFVPVKICGILWRTMKHLRRVPVGGVDRGVFLQRTFIITSWGNSKKKKKRHQNHIVPGVPLIFTLTRPNEVSTHP